MNILVLCLSGDSRVSLWHQRNKVQAGRVRSGEAPPPSLPPGPLLSSLFSLPFSSPVRPCPLLSLSFPPPLRFAYRRFFLSVESVRLNGEVVCVSGVGLVVGARPCHSWMVQFRLTACGLSVVGLATLRRRIVLVRCLGGFSFWAYCISGRSRAFGLLHGVEVVGRRVVDALTQSLVAVVGGLRQ